jgi:hypothetical protein
METLIFSTKNGTVVAQPTEVIKEFGRLIQVWQMQHLTEAGVRKLRDEYTDLGVPVSQEQAEHIAWLRTPEGIKANRKELENVIKELRKLE